MTWVEEARRELTAEKKRATRHLGEATRLRDENTILRRRLAGALYQIYGSWSRVNRELP